ncbi:MAG: DMT family transporter [Proteobacteria bacterium]|nr:DMT family transporter [Pseudomonadota bacterium]
MNTGSPSFAVGLSCGLVVPFIWGGWIVASRFGVLNALTPYDVAAIRVGFAAIIVLPLLLTRGLAGLPLWKGAVLSFGVGVPFALTSFGGMALAPVVHAGVLTNGAMPIFAAVIGYYWLRELPARSQIGGMLLIVVGGTMIGGDSFSLDAPPGQWLGDLLLIGAAGCFALYMTALRRWNVTIVQVLIAVPTISSAIYIPIWLLFLPSGLLQFDNFPPWQEVALQTVYQGVVASFIVVILVTRATRALSATTMAVLLAGAPALAVLFGIVLLDEVPTTLAWAGLAVTTLGMVLAVGRRART